MIDIDQFISFFNTLKNRLPPLQSLLAFEAAARLGGLSRAADELALTQSAITHQIQNLEAWVGQALFRRIGRGVELTSAGELFCDTVRGTLKMLKDGRERIEPYRNPNSVILSCSRDFASGWLIARLPALKAQHPGMEIWIATREELKDIDRIDVDLIVTTTVLENVQLESVRLLDDCAIAVCGPRMAAQLQALPFPQVLMDAPLIIDEQRPEWAPWLQPYRDQGVLSQRSITVDDSRLQLSAAESELGIAMMSQLTADSALASGRIMALPQVPSFPLSTHWLMKSRLAARTPAVEVVYRWLQTTAGVVP